MHARWSAIVLLPIALVAFCSRASAQSSGVVAIDQPNEGEALRGSVEISGTADISGFAVADLSFAYEGDTTDTWFTLVEIDRPITGSRLGTWDTTAISDGDYRLRLQVRSQAGSLLQAVIHVQVRNYTAPVPPTATVTATPSPIARVPTAMILPVVVTSTSAPAVQATATPLPANSAAVSDSAVFDMLARGAVVAAALGMMLAFAIFRRRA
jgi:hypothetical protein